jgi:hypothetical protein
MDFDYSEASVGRLDDFAGQLWDPDRPPGEDELDNLTKLMGAYLGEVMIRHVRGRWRWDPDGRIPVIETDPGRLTYVLDKVYKRQVMGKEHDLATYYEEFKGWASRS